jgi:hypothetical protein
VNKWLQRGLDHVFRLEEINGGERCPTYLYRWTLLKAGSYGMYLHKFVGDDWSRDLHDHPKRFISVGLKGAYVEETFAADDDPFRGHWEVFTSSDGETVHVRWSERDDAGRWFFNRHYPNTPWGQNACEGEAKRMNAAGRVPWQDSEFRPARATTSRIFRAPWIRTFPADHIHRLSLIDRRPCWTLVVVLRTVRPWGFWHAGEWIPWRQYVNSELATRMKNCQ